jgi:CheY-like chemotaxis protein
MNKINTVCVIDDDLIYSLAVRHIIKRSEVAASTIFFENGRVAINFIRQHQHQQDLLPDLILLDLNMPVLDGWQFLEEFEVLRDGLAKSIPLYIVSSSINEEEFKRAENIPCVNDFISKPITVLNLQEIVANM